MRRVQLVAPTSTDERIAACAAATDGWLYLVTPHRHDRRARRGLPRARGPRRADARATPTCRSTPASASRRPSTRAAVAELADGVVVGSAALDAADEGATALEHFVGSLREALDR